MEQLEIEDDANNAIDQVLRNYGVDPPAFEVFAQARLRDELMDSEVESLERKSSESMLSASSRERYCATEPGEGVAKTRAFCEDLLEVFDSCGQSMEQMTTSLNELMSEGLDDLPDTFAHEVDEPTFTQLTEFIRQDPTFWDELLIMQNEVPRSGGKIVINGTTSKAYPVFADPIAALQDMLGVFDEFEEEIAELHANLQRDEDEIDALSIHGVESPLHCSVPPDTIPAQSTSAEDTRSAQTPPLDSEEPADSLEPPVPSLPGIAEEPSEDEPISPDSTTTVFSSIETPSTSSMLEKTEQEPRVIVGVDVIELPRAALVPGPLRHGGVWDDLDVMTLNPTKQVVAERSCLDEYDHSPEGVALRLIASQLEAAALRPIDAPRLLSLAAAGAGLVAYSAWYSTSTTAASAQAVQYTIATHPRLLGVLWVAGFAANVAAVSLPGRLDRMYSEKTHLKPWQSLFEPSSWAFAIWAMIYLLEAATVIGVLAALSCGTSQVVRTIATRLLPLWLGGNVAQALWCFVFRPQFSSRLWVPTLVLFLAAACYGLAHAEVRSTLRTTASLDPLQGAGPAVCANDSLCADTLSVWEWTLLLALRGTLSTHCTWLLVSAVVTLNSWLTVSYGERVRGLLPSAGFLSAFVLFLCGAWLTSSTGDPMFAVTIAWALDATAHRSLQKTAMVPSPMDKKAVSSDVHETLAGVENLLSGAAKCVAVGTLAAPLVRAFVSFVSM